MKLRQSPGGTWCGTEKDYVDALKKEGIKRKDYTGREFVEVPTDKAGLMEFLTFHNVNCITGPGPAAPVRIPPATALNNAVEEIFQSAEAAGMGGKFTTIPDFPIDLDTQFAAAPLSQRLRLAVTAIDAADAALYR